MRGAIWPKRSTTPATPKSGEQDDQTAPRLVAASIAITVSGMFGMNPAEAPTGRPEPLRRCDRPAVQRVIVGDVRPILPTHCCDEGGQVCAGHPVGRRRPEGGVVQSYFVTLGDAVTLRVMT